MKDIIAAIHKIYDQDNPSMEGIKYTYTNQDGSPLDNPIDGLEWNNKDYPKPTWSSILSELPKIKLDDLKNKKKLDLKKIRDNSFSQNVTHPKGNFPASKTAITLLSALVSGWNGSTNELWRDVDNNMVSLTKTECKEIIRAIRDVHTPIYAKEGAIAIQIDALTDLKKLESFDIQAAWDAL